MMKKRGIWGHPRLCLCLILLVGLSSCTSRQVVTTNKQDRQEQIPVAVWQMEVRFLPGYGVMDLGLTEDMPQPSDNGTERITLKFRDPAPDYLLNIRSALMASGKVESVEFWRIGTVN